MRRIITYGGYFERFMSTLSDVVIKKIDYALTLLKTYDRVPWKFIKYLKDGLYELRVEWEGNIYRVFFVFDDDNVVVLFNGFMKKTQKTPKEEIKKAKRIKNEYYGTR